MRFSQKDHGNISEWKFLEILCCEMFNVSVRAQLVLTSHVNGLVFACQSKWIRN